jgi:limonene-1,2-epoxide hydrolase
MSISLSNSSDIIANSISLINGNVVQDIKDTFLSKNEAVSNIVGLPPTTMNTLEKISQSLSNNPNFFNTIETAIASKASSANVNATFLEYDTRVISEGKIGLKANTLEVTASLSSINDKFSNYDTKAIVTTKLQVKANASEVTASLNTINTKFNNYETALVTNEKLGLVYLKTEVDSKFSNLINSAPEAMNQLSELSNALDNDSNYAATIQNQFATKSNIANTVLKAVSGKNSIVTLNDSWRINSVDDINLKIQRFDGDGAIRTDSYLDVANFIYNTDTNKAGLEMNGVDILTLLQGNYTNAEIDALDDLKQDVLSSGAVGLSLLSPSNQIYNILGGTTMNISSTYDNVLENGAFNRGNYRHVFDLSSSILNKINDPP